ncbi:phosphatidate cytidylyltransferase [Asanoa hainanensis]|uniref:Phosphatidate cytidylyltransferase n=1 Tax=Asanoa hainanensis TaxID=560556 RepID=A0A239PCG5_9ACTN|nr:phosphatidate cytidylyltransferase [Asanoa hainanensis]SNT64731.1 phosphatidate cytidylyltransferase [Asanoa hainanensis]
MSYSDPYSSADPLRARHSGVAPEKYDPGFPTNLDVPGWAGPTQPGIGLPEPDPRREQDVNGYTAETAQLPLVTPRAQHQPGGGDDAGEDPAPPRRPGPGKRRAGPGKPPTAQKTSRAGRNLPAAIGVGVTLGAVLLVSLYAYKPAFLGVLALAVAVGIWEVSRAFRQVKAHPPAIPLIAGGVLMVGLAWYAGADALMLGLVATLLAATVWRLADGPKGFKQDLTASVLIAVYVPFLAGFAALLAVPQDGADRVLVVLIGVVLSDTGGYAAGVFLGRHPMAPSVSPKKSWEGFGGSLVAAAIGTALSCYFLLSVDFWWGALIGAAISVAAVLGDLGESMLKRDLGIKDMSRLLPGHGGLMDRLDSILFAVPTAYLLLAIFAPVR